MTNKYITVLDFEVSRIFQYKLESFVKQYDGAHYYDNEYCEDYLTNKGHRLKDCSWMVHENNDIVSHPDINNE